MGALNKLGLESYTDTVTDVSDEQRQTQRSFGFKWSKRETYESEAVATNLRRWLIERYCNGDPEQVGRWLEGGRKLIVDAGCGAGLAGLLFFGEHLRRHDYLGVDISSALDQAKLRFGEAGLPGDFLRADLLKFGAPDESVDIIFSEGVLHHTDSTELAISTLARKLKPGGRFLFYVYAKKAVIREFADDHIREAIRPLTDEEAWKALEPLSKLGMELGRLKVELQIPEDIPYLGIKAGKMDIQRFFYWNIFKAYYRDEFSLDEINHINFDWYRPLNCQRHTEAEIRLWCREANLEIEHFDRAESGFTVVARKNES